MRGIIDNDVGAILQKYFFDDKERKKLRPLQAVRGLEFRRIISVITLKMIELACNS